MWGLGDASQRDWKELVGICNDNDYKYRYHSILNVIYTDPVPYTAMGTDLPYLYLSDDIMLRFSLNGACSL